MSKKIVSMNYINLATVTNQNSFLIISKVKTYLRKNDHHVEFCTCYSQSVDFSQYILWLVNIYSSVIMS